jgi:hypothetical protein
LEILWELLVGIKPAQSGKQGVAIDGLGEGEDALVRDRGVNGRSDVE